MSLRRVATGVGVAFGGFGLAIGSTISGVFAAGGRIGVTASADPATACCTGRDR